jgi:hypothetical protein
MAERIPAIIKATALALRPRTLYVMAAYAKDGNVVCFFQSAQKFKTRYATLGFSDKANLDDGDMWPTTFALKGLTAADEARIGALVQRAVRSGPSTAHCSIVVDRFEALPVCQSPPRAMRNAVDVPGR